MGICALYVFLYFVKPFESPKALYKFPINPFTAILAVLSLGNRPVKSAKSVRERNSIKMHSIESRFVTGPIQFWSVYMCIFQPGNFTGCGSEGVNNYYYWSVLFGSHGCLNCSQLKAIEWSLSVVFHLFVQTPSLPLPLPSLCYRFVYFFLLSVELYYLL